MFKFLRKLICVHSYREYVVLPEDIDLLKAITSLEYKRTWIKKLAICRECGKTNLGDLK
jgi:hypothetical protein